VDTRHGADKRSGGLTRRSPSRLHTTTSCASPMGRAQDIRMLAIREDGPASLAEESGGRGPPRIAPCRDDLVPDWPGRAPFPSRHSPRSAWCTRWRPSLTCSGIHAPRDGRARAHGAGGGPRVLRARAGSQQNASLAGTGVDRPHRPDAHGGRVNLSRGRSDACRRVSRSWKRSVSVVNLIVEYLFH